MRFGVTPLIAGMAALVAVNADSTITTAPTVPTERAIYGRQNTYETTSPLPLTAYTYSYGQQPYQVNPYPIGRGPQSGYNICNSTTEGANSQCQTAIVNNITDFCIWGSPTNDQNASVGDIEAATVAYCTRSGYGARIFPAGAITGVQFMRTQAYIQIVGFFNQESINLNFNDGGGELDPHGDDGLGNPVGGLMYSIGFTSGNNMTYVQALSWNNFIDSNRFCIKLCDPVYNSGSTNYCQNIYDLLGCDYNMPANYAAINGTYQSCDGDMQTEVGTYTSGGQTITFSQPSELPAGTTLPWTPNIPASSNCVTYQSSDLWPASDLGYQSANSQFLGGAVVTGSASSSGSSASTTSGASGSNKSGSSASASKTASASGSSASASKSGAAMPKLAKPAGGMAILALIGGLFL